MTQDSPRFEFRPLIFAELRGDKDIRRGPSYNSALTVRSRTNIRQKTINIQKKIGGDEQKGEKEAEVKDVKTEKEADEGKD